MPPIITLLTDFGTADSYVGEVKGTLLSRVHGAALFDITHQVPPGDLRAGQYILARAWHRFPQGTVHLVVVDPGVGTTRRALAAGAAGHFFVAPDNGLLSCLPSDAHFVSLPIPPGAAPTFHARDVFAPAAAQLAIGASLTQLGHTITDPYASPLPAPRHEARQLRQLTVQLALAVGHRTAFPALREVQFPRGGEETLSPPLGLIGSEVLQPEVAHCAVLRSPRSRGFTPAVR